MFTITYKIVDNVEMDDYYGESGFLQLSCNGFTFGYIFPEECEKIMDIVYLNDWFEGFLQVLQDIESHGCVFFNDIESYNTWIKFELKSDKVSVSIIRSEKFPGVHEIEYEVNKLENGEWFDQLVEYKQFKEEIIKKASMYVNETLKRSNHEIPLKLKKQLECLKREMNI